MVMSVQALSTKLLVSRGAHMVCVYAEASF